MAARISEWFRSFFRPKASRPDSESDDENAALAYPGNGVLHAASESAALSSPRSMEFEDMEDDVLDVAGGSARGADQAFVIASASAAVTAFLCAMSR